jgi:hypothetical protein
MQKKLIGVSNTKMAIAKPKLQEITNICKNWMNIEPISLSVVIITTTHNNNNNEYSIVTLCVYESFILSLSPSLSLSLSLSLHFQLTI